MERKFDVRKTKEQNQNGNVNGLSWRDFRVSEEEMAHRKALKEYFDTLDEETQIREFEKLSLSDMHFLAVTKLQEDHRKGKRLT